MPADQHLKYVEIKEFGGLWTNGGRHLMPTNYLQVLSGAQPQKAGGLRAFWQPSEQLDSTDLADTGHTRIIQGFGVYSDADAVGTETGNAIGNRYHVVTSQDNGVNSWRMYHRQDLDGGGDTAWHPILVADGALFHDSSGSYQPAQVQFLRIGIDAGTGLETQFYVLINHQLAFSSPVSGIYKFVGDPVGTELARVTWSDDTDYAFLNALVGHQSRIIYGKVGTIIGSELPASEPADPDADDSLFLTVSDVGANHLPALNRADISWLLPIPPGDLLVGTQRGGLYNVQGDFADPVTREIGRWGNSAPQQPILTPFGPVVIFPAMGPRILGADGRVNDLSKAIDPETWQTTLEHLGLGSMAFADGLLYAPNFHDRGDEPGTLNNGPLVYDFETSAWFTAVHPDVLSVPNPQHIQTGDGLNVPGVFVATGAEIPDGDDTVPTIVNFPGPSTAALSPARRRASKYEVTTAPFRSPDGLQVEIQELQLPVFGWDSDEDGGTVAITVTNEAGATFTKTYAVPAGPSTITISRPMQGQFLEINLVFAASDPDFEAPMLEALRIGHRPTSSIYQTPVS